MTNTEEEKKRRREEGREKKNRNGDTERDGEKTVVSPRPIDRSEIDRREIDRREGTQQPLPPYKSYKTSLSLSLSLFLSLEQIIHVHLWWDHFLESVEHT